MLNQFYNQLTELREKIGERKLSKCDGHDTWPKRGVYFFFEEGEYREKSSDLRVVRVGTHAVSYGSRTKLWDRLRAHRGPISTGGGNHRGSIFRLHVGSAILMKEGIRDSYPDWGVGSSAPKEIREQEATIEKRVSCYIGNMPFLWINVDDTSSKTSKRKYLEENAIALLSNYGRINTSEALDPASKHWLGRHCYHCFVRESGLWNVKHVTEKKIDGNFLDFLEKKVSEM